jgi:hypothetical protein
MRNAYTISVEIPKRGDHFGDLNVKIDVEGAGVSVWTGLSLLRTWSSGGLI